MKTTIEYVPQSGPPRITRGKQLLGGYQVKFEDGFQVFIAHNGYPGTVRAEPLDPDIPEHRQVILNEAERARKAAAE